jgi:glutamate dehydrogenase
LASERGFWLDDAFASGGSNGYDHKALGVTARGAWVAATRHFAELGIDVAIDPTRVIGIGDMSGDVFGNGLLRSRAVRLVAAFDHRHILLDPDPDPEAGFAARQALFDLPSSSWEDIDRDSLGPGAMIVRRDAKWVELNDAVRALLQTDADRLSPAELIQSILRAPADLLFAGGIGTYVKASTERHAELGDRANDELRVDASDLRVRISAEGANLALTPRARVEFARRGGHVNQDAIDNAAGVATSDLEVNLKILFRLAGDDGELDRATRDELLRSLADDVVAAALGVVDRQAAGISREIRRLPGHLDSISQVLTDLESRHGLDRAQEVLPDEQELQRRNAADAGLSRPEIASIVGWVKRDLSEQLLTTDLLDTPIMRPVLEAAFPVPLRQRFRAQIDRHRLRRELIATGLANTVVDRMGPVFAPILAADSRQPVTTVLAAFQVARLGLDAESWWAELDALERTHGPDRVRELEPQLEQLLATWTRIRMSSSEQDSSALVADWTRIRELVQQPSSNLGSDASRRARDTQARWLIDDLVEPTLARRLADAPVLALVPDIAVTAARLKDVAPSVVADTMVRADDALGLNRLEQGLQRTTTGSPWGRAQRLGLLDDLRRIRRRATRLALTRYPTDPSMAIQALFDRRREALQAAQQDVAAATATTDMPLDATAVAVRRLIDALD